MSFSFDEMIRVFEDIFRWGSSSTTFFFLKMFLALYLVVLLADIILLFSLRPVNADLQKGLWGTRERPVAPPWLRRLRWRRIERQINSKERGSTKLAVMEASVYVDGILRDLGYSGENAGERIDAIGAQHFETIDALREAHEIRNRIVLDTDFVLDAIEARRVLDLYRSFLDEAEIFSN